MASTTQALQGVEKPEAEYEATTGPNLEAAGVPLSGGDSANAASASAASASSSSSSSASSLAEMDELDSRFQELLTKALKEAEERETTKEKAILELTAHLMAKPLEYMTQSFFDQTPYKTKVTVTLAHVDILTLDWVMEFKTTIVSSRVEPTEVPVTAVSTAVQEALGHKDRGYESDVEGSTTTRAVQAVEQISSEVEPEAEGGSGLRVDTMPSSATEPKELHEETEEEEGGRVHREDSPFWSSTVDHA